MLGLPLEDQVRLFIKKQARKLIEDCGMTVPPILAAEIAQRQGIEVSEADLKGVSGLLKPSAEGLQIKIQADDSERRKNYSCAHELMHTFLLDGEVIAKIEAIKKKRGFLAAKRFEERLCEIGAAELLMPYEMFKKEVDKRGLSIKSVKPLAQLFFTSFEAVAIRMAETSRGACLAVAWPTEQVLPQEPAASRIEYATTLKFRSSHSATKTTFFRPKIAFDPGTIHACKYQDFIYSNERLVTQKLSIPCRVESMVLSREPLRVISLLFPKESHLV